jgi:hypothetical protein
MKVTGASWTWRGSGRHGRPEDIMDQLEDLPELAGQVV